VVVAEVLAAHRGHATLGSAGADVAALVDHG
jgi:hypothetical protein